MHAATTDLWSLEARQLPGHLGVQAPNPLLRAWLRECNPHIPMKNSGKKRMREEDGEVNMTEEDSTRRTLRLLLSVACERVAEKQLVGGFSIGNSHWYHLEGEEGPTDPTVTSSIELEMRSMMQQGMTIVEGELSYLSAIKYFEASMQPLAAKQLRARVPRGGRAVVWVVEFQDKTYYRLKHFPLLSNASLLSHRDFSVLSYTHGGFVLVNGEEFNDQTALASSITRQTQWARRTKITCTADICGIPDTETARGVFVFSAEARLEAEITECCRQIVQRHTKQGGGVKVVCIAGPTASGKTTFSHKLALALQSQGVLASPLTVDHYYLPLVEQPKYKLRQNRNDVDYDSIESMDIGLVQQHIMELSAGKTVLTPVYNMKTGNRDPPGKQMALPTTGDHAPILIIEGIHALNPEYTSQIPAENKFKIFISPIPALQLDDFNVVKSTDFRLCRRMSRDYLFRGNGATRTLTMWNNVRRGEEKWIFPHQNEADYVINSAMEYEMCVLKSRLEWMLRGVAPDVGSLNVENPIECPIFAKATLMLHMLDSVPSWESHPVPCASLMREFIGGSAFDVH